MVKRPCSHCGQEQARKKVWAWGKGKRVLCMTCGRDWCFGSDGITVMPWLRRRRGLSDEGLPLVAEMFANEAIDVDAICEHVRREKM